VHHQNGVAESSIQTVVSWARTFLLHAAIHWPEMTDLKLWPFALQHAVYLWNILPDQYTKLSPLELITFSRVPNYTHLQRSHVWGCLTFLLDPRLQDGKKIPKWCFLGYSTCHSSTVSLILNLKTGSVTPQILFMMIGLVQSPMLHPLFFLNPCGIILYLLVMKWKF